MTWQSRFLILTVLAVGLSAPAQRRYVDEKHGYAVRTLRKWDPLPVDPTDPTVAARWASPRLDENGWGRMAIHVFDRAAQKPDPTATAAEKKEGPPKTPEDVAARLRRALRAFPSYAKWLAARRPGFELGEGEPLRAKAPGGVPVTAKLYEAEHDRWYLVVGVYTTPTREYAVELLCTRKGKRKYRRLFRRVAKSLEIHTPPPPTVSAQPGASSARGRALERARRDAQRVPGWWYIESEHYFLVTNVPKKKKKRLLDLRRRLEAIRKHYEKDFPPAKPIEAVSIVRVCKDRKTYHQYGGPPGTGGYWNPTAEELVIYLRGDKAFARSVLNHEAFHQYLHYAAGGARPHTWFNEGHADYYGGCEVRGNRLIVEPNAERIDHIRNLCHIGEYVPLKKILRFSQADYYRDAARCYAQGWSLVYFLRQGVPPEHPWARILPTYYRVLCQTGSADKALAAAFRGVDMKAFEKAWVRFVTRGDKVRL